MIQLEVPARIESPTNSNITDLLVERVAENPKLPLFAHAEGTTWKDQSAEDFLEQVKALAKGFIAAGIQPGQAVGIMSKTRYEWTLVDFALWFAGAVSVPIYETSAPSQIEWILSDSDAVALVLESAELMKRFEEIKSNAPLVRQVWTMDSKDLEKLVQLGKKEVSAETLEQRRTSAKLDDIATLIYTSGTTGRPKGCELSHRGFVDLSRNATLVLPKVVYAGASTLLFLPLAHVLARFISVICIHAGVKVGHQPDTKNVMPAMLTFKPSFLLAVPRVFEKVYNTAEQKAEASGKGKIFRLAAHTAIAYSKALDTSSGPSLSLRLKFKVLDALVLSKLRKAMGGRVSYAVSGGAPLGTRLGHFFRALGLVVLEGYGLTETTAPALLTRPENIKIGKVGSPLPGCGVKIAADGEILLNGSNLLKSYWRNPTATSEAMVDGWFRTGDLGELDDEGYLTITGRKKEMIVTSGGKNVAPAPLEDPLRADPIIGQAVLVGDRRPFVAALIFLDPEMLPLWLANNQLPADLTLVQAVREPKIVAEVQAAVDRVNKGFSKAEQIRKFVLVPNEISEDTGHLTPSLKVKREKVLTDFDEYVEQVYDGGSPTEEISVLAGN
ncbi:MAG: hypothetical protein RL670_184 [Actinomycetota bacterium]